MAALLDITRDALSCNAPEEPVQEIFAAAAATAVGKPQRVQSQVHASPGGHFLFEFACAADSSLGRIGEELGVQVVL